MATFPTLTPSTSQVAPGGWPVSAISGLSGAESRIRQGSAEIGRRLRLTFVNVTESDFLAILNHYRGQRSGFDPFGFNTATLAADLTPAGYAWLYTSRPQVVDEHVNCFTVSCEFKSEPRGLVTALGKAWQTSATTLAVGSRDGGVIYAAGKSWATSSTTLTIGVTITWAAGASNVTYSNANSTVTYSTSSSAYGTTGRTITSSTSKSSGKWYAEMSADLLTASGTFNSRNDTWFGMAANATSTYIYPGGAGSGGIALTGSRGPEQNALGATLSGSTLGYSSGSGRILMIAVDFDAKKLWLGADGTWLASGNPAAGTGASASGWSGTPTWYIAFVSFFSNDAATLQGIPNYVVPTGFSRWAD